MIRSKQYQASTLSLVKRLVAMLVIGTMFFPAVVATSQTQTAEQRLAAENELARENLRLTEEVTQRWRDWLATDAKVLEKGEMSFPNLHGERGLAGLKAQLQAATLIVTPELAVDLADAATRAPAVSEITRQQIALGNLEIADQIIENQLERVGLLNLLSDAANYAEIEGRPELLDWVDAKIAAVPQPVSDAENLAFGIQLDKAKVEFIATAARLELLRSQDADRHSIAIEETANKMREIANRMGNHFRGVGVQRNAIEFSKMESWSSFKSEASVRVVKAAVEKHPSLVPLSTIAKRYSWPSGKRDAGEVATALGLAPTWVARQSVRGRYEAAIALVVQSDFPMLTKVSLLSQISRSIVTSNKKLAIQCAEVARALLNEALECELNEQYWSVLECVSDLAIAYQAIGDSESALKLLVKATEFWTTHDNEEELQGGQAYSLLALLEAVAVTDFQLKDLDPRLRQITENCLSWGSPQMDLKFDAKRHHVRRYPTTGFPRTIDTTKFHSSDQVRSEEKSYPEYFRWFDMKFWPQAIEAFRSSKNYEVSRERNAAFDLQIKSQMFGQVIQGSLQHCGLKGTLDWTKEIEEPSVRMALELEAVLREYRGKTTIPTRTSNSLQSVVPFTLAWGGC